MSPSKNQISVKKAILVGKIIDISFYLFFIVLIVIIGFRVDFFDNNETTFFILVLLIYFIIRLTRGYILPIWQNWAFEKVRNVHILWEISKYERLVMDSIYFSYKSKKTKLKWEELQEKFKDMDDFTDQVLPFKEIHLTHKNFAKKLILLSSILIAMGISFLIFLDTILFGIIIITFGLLLLFYFYKNKNEADIEIQLNKEGVSIADEFIPWFAISKVSLERQNSWFNRTPVLKIASEKLTDDFEIHKLPIPALEIIEFIYYHSTCSKPT